MKDHSKAHDGLPEGLAALGEWHITEFTNESAGLTLRGRFHASPFQTLDADQTRFLVTFLRCRGVLSSVERELGISYPTVRARLDNLLKTMGLAAAEPPEPAAMSERHKEIISKLESGELTPEQAKKAMKEAIR